MSGLPLRGRAQANKKAEKEAWKVSIDQQVKDGDRLGPRFTKNLIAEYGITMKEVKKYADKKDYDLKTKLLTAPKRELRQIIGEAKDAIKDIRDNVEKYPKAPPVPKRYRESGAAGGDDTYKEQIEALKNLMIEQKTNFDNQIAEAQLQRTAMAAQAAETAREAAAMQRAFVPDLEMTAAAPVIGDNRTAYNTRRNAATNTLSTLSILTGLGGMNSAGVTTSIAGLQIP